MKLFSVLIASSVWIPASVKCKQESFASCPAWCCLKRNEQNAALRERRLQSFPFSVGARFHPKYSRLPYLQTKKCALTKSRAVGQVLGCSADHPLRLTWALKHSCSLPSTLSLCWRAAIPRCGEGAPSLSEPLQVREVWLFSSSSASRLHLRFPHIWWRCRAGSRAWCCPKLWLFPPAEATIASVLCAGSLNKGDSCFAKARP